MKLNIDACSIEIKKYLTKKHKQQHPTKTFQIFKKIISNKLDYHYYNPEEYKQSTPYQKALEKIRNLRGKHKLVLSGMKLKYLPPIPECVTILECEFNLLKTLQPLPPKLKYLICRGNYLTSLPELPKTLELLVCNSNRLTSLPILPHTLKDLQCSKSILQDTEYQKLRISHPNLRIVRL
jgi:Leucine-rich repeat (LRR) protein